MFSMAHPQFHKHLPDMISKFPHHPCEMAKGSTDVAINQLRLDRNDRNWLVGWNVLFQQKHYNTPRFTQHKRSLPREGGGLRLFGRVRQEDTLQCIVQLTAASASQREGYIITLESA